MRLMRSQLTDEVAVVGLRIGPGATVDVDQVVGEATTLADALGPGLLAGFAPLEAAEAPSRRDRGRPTAPAPASEQE